jgi:polysaccharide pyruvyl transferase WcaK-like protein
MLGLSGHVAMRILVEPSDYVLQNAGDMAMLQVAITRLGALWPDAAIDILSDTPDLLPAYGPNSFPLDARGRKAWFSEGALLGPLCGRLPFPLASSGMRLERYLRRRHPLLMSTAVRWRLRQKGHNHPLNAFLETVAAADMIFVSGMGGITDAFSDYAFQLLDILELGIESGAVTAMVGQGIGPLGNPELLAHAKAVLPRVDFIALREARSGEPLLRSLSVSPNRVMTTGDDAVELAFRTYPAQPGNGIGINVRVSDYAGVDHAVVERIRPVVRRFAATYRVPMIPLPISRVPEENEAAIIRKLIGACGKEATEKDATDPSLAVIERIKGCRAVMVGSYHAAVFALAMGIPAVCLSNSPYYRDKFLGLARQFGEGCRVVFLDDPNLSATLAGEMDWAWRHAGALRPGLLAAAERQIALSRAAYQRVYDLVLSRQEKYQRTFAVG